MIGCVDMFCGCGGITCGLISAGVTVVCGYDINGACEYAYVENNGVEFVLADVRDVDPAEVKGKLSGFDYTCVAGGPPCQQYTRFNRRKRDEDTSVIDAYLNIIRFVMPDFVFMENVPDIRKYDGYRRVVNGLSEAGYIVNDRVVDCHAELGLPQKRRRLVLTAGRSFVFDFPIREAERKLTLRDVIFHLPAIENGGVDKNDPVHSCCRISELNERRLACIPPGGDWRDLPDELQLESRKNMNRKWYTGTCGRLEWDKPCTTIIGKHGGFCVNNAGHPEQNRLLSNREAAIVQGFPSDYKFPVHVGYTEIRRMIGNAVPPPLAEAIGKRMIELAGVVKCASA